MQLKIEQPSIFKYLKFEKNNIEIILKIKLLKENLKDLSIKKNKLKDF